MGTNSMPLLTCLVVVFSHGTSFYGPGSVVGIATAYWLDGSGIESRWGGEIFRTSPVWPWGPPSLLYNAYQVFPEGKVQLGCDAKPSPLSSAEVKNRAIILLSLRAFVAWQGENYLPPSQTPTNMSQDYYCKPASHVNLTYTHQLPRVSTQSNLRQLCSIAGSTAWVDVHTLQQCTAVNITFHIHHALRVLEQ
jgi:hypothetical protein